MSKGIISTSCDPQIQHSIYDHNEIVHFYQDVYLKLVPITKDGFEGELIGVHACEKNGDLIENGLILVLENGEIHRIPNLNTERLHFLDLDSKGRINVLN